MADKNTTGSPENQEGKETQPNGGQGSPVYRGIDTSKYASIFKDESYTPPTPPEKYDPKAWEQYSKDVQAYEAGYRNRQSLRSQFRSIAETGQLKVGSDTHQLSEEQVRRVLEKVEKGVGLTAESIFSAELAPDLMAQARKSAEKKQVQEERRENQPPPRKPAEKDTVTVGGTQTAEDSQKPFIDRYLSQIPPKDVDSKVVFNAVLKAQMSEEQWAAYKAGELEIEGPFGEEEKPFRL